MIAHPLDDELAGAVALVAVALQRLEVLEEGVLALTRSTAAGAVGAVAERGVGGLAGRGVGGGIKPAGRAEALHLMRETDTARVLALVGATATGKTALSWSWPGTWGRRSSPPTSRMVYRWMDVGTAKPGPEERARVPHHLLDVADPDESYSVALYQRQALDAIARIHRRGRVPSWWGARGCTCAPCATACRSRRAPGRGLPGGDGGARAGRGGRCCSGSWSGSIRERRAHRARNVRRVIGPWRCSAPPGSPSPPGRCAVPLLSGPSLWGWLPRPRLYARIDARVLEQMEAGLVEVRSLVDRGYDSKSTAMSGFGYREVAAYLRGEYGREEAVARYQQACATTPGARRAGSALTGASTGWTPAG